MVRSSGCACEREAPVSAPELGSPGPGLGPEVMVGPGNEMFKNRRPGVVCGLDD